MLNIYINGVEGEIYSTDAWFDWNYEKEWITDDDSIKMIKDIDKSTVLGNGAIESPVLGIISPEQLSGGVKTLILINNDPNNIFCANQCGDNCAEWLMRIADNKDIYITLHHTVDFSKVDNLNIKIMNTGKVVNTYEDYLDECIEVEANE